MHSRDNNQTMSFFKNVKWYFYNKRSLFNNDNRWSQKLKYTKTLLCTLNRPLQQTRITHCAIGDNKTYIKCHNHLHLAHMNVVRRSLEEGRQYFSYKTATTYPSIQTMLLRARTSDKALVSNDCIIRDFTTRTVAVWLGLEITTFGAVWVRRSTYPPMPAEC